ncbi:hypothetical protein ACFX2I_014606 [Malus domestica]
MLKKPSRYMTEVKREKRVTISLAGAVKPVKENENPKFALDFCAPSVSEYSDRISVRFARPNNREADLLNLEPFEGFLVSPSLDGNIRLGIEAEADDD